MFVVKFFSSRDSKFVHAIFIRTNNPRIEMKHEPSREVLGLGLRISG